MRTVYKYKIKKYKIICVSLGLNIADKRRRDSLFAAVKDDQVVIDYLFSKSVFFKSASVRNIKSFLMSLPTRDILWTP